MSVRTIFLIVACWVASTVSAQALSPMQPAAVVNDAVITVYDVQQRIDLTLVQTQAPRTKENRFGIARAVLDNLVLEHLHLGEAKRLGLLPTERDIADAIGRYESERNIAAGGIEGYLGSEGIDYQSFVAGIRATLAWQNVILEHINPQVVITDTEIAHELERIKQNLARSNAREVRLQLILLPEGRNSGQTLSQATELRRTLLSGAQFSELARQFSADLSAQYGGDLGWLDPSELSPPIQQWLENAEERTVSPVIRLPEGIALFRLLETREASIENLNEETIRNRIGNIKMQTKVRGLERTLQQEAVITYKLKL